MQVCAERRLTVGGGGGGDARRAFDLELILRKGDK